MRCGPESVLQLVDRAREVRGQWLSWLCRLHSIEERLDGDGAGSGDVLTLLTIEASMADGGKQFEWDVGCEVDFDRHYGRLRLGGRSQQVSGYVKASDVPGCRS